MAPFCPKTCRNQQGSELGKEKVGGSRFRSMAGMLIQAGGGCTAAGSPPAPSEPVNGCAPSRLPELLPKQLVLMNSKQAGQLWALSICMGRCIFILTSHSTLQLPPSPVPGE